MEVTPKSRSVVPEVLDVHVIPSDEVRMVPDPPTATNLLFPKVTPFKVCDEPEVLEVQVVPLSEVQMVPELPTVTKDGVNSVANPLPVSY